MNIQFSKRFFFLFLFILFFAPYLVSADVADGNEDFFVEKDYDWYSREKISARLRNLNSRAYFYIDNQWWEGLSFEEKKETIESLNVLGKELYYVIYPKLTSEYGFEWSPGIDKDKRITVLIHPMVKNADGYFRSADEYPKSQIPNSNQREMLYINAFEITNNIAPSLLAHELTHLITFNQKNINFGTEEEVWLNEARAEYAPTLCGYNNYYNGSYLESRVEIFSGKPSDSLIEWENTLTDYGALNLFTHYLVEKYGLEILTDSLRSSKTGIDSINGILKQKNYEEDFSQIFTDWTIAVLVNDCSLGEKYCYSNNDLRKIRVNPSINFLPMKGESSLEVSREINSWSGNWLKFIGGKSSIKIQFIGNPANSFKVPYIIKDTSGNNSLYFFDLDENQKGEVAISDFGSEKSSIIIIPSVSETEPSAYFFCSVSTLFEEVPVSDLLDKPVEEMTEQEIRSKIKELEDILGLLKTWLQKIVSVQEENKKPETACQSFDNDLYYGLKNDQVMCLQDFLKSLGSDVYPEGLVTGFFGNLTQRAVIKFQEKFAGEILNPLNLTHGTGYVGDATRSKLNSLLFGN